jgi:NAD(P)-dependent dehydrogenase (short-subunit alcohol dehydrogenase family)
MTAMRGDATTEQPVAVVTGAEGGIGKSVVARLVADGMKVAAIDVRVNTEENDDVFPFACDVSDPVAIDALAPLIAEQVGRVSAVVNCAGIGLWFKRVGELSVEEWNRVIGVNLSGAFLVTRAFLPALIERQGCVVNISSVHGIATAPGSAAYAASKAGLFGLTKGLAVDYAEEGVRANAIVLGSIDTDMTRNYEVAASARGESNIQIRQRQRTGPRAVADVVSFLLSDDAAFINGALVPVDGGLLSWL